MSAWKYKQVTPKILVNKLRLIQAKEIIGLVGSPVSQVCSKLAKTPYQKEISEIPSQQINSISLEGALLKNFLRTVDEIAEFSPKSIRVLLTRILTKFEANTLKAILRAKSGGIPADRAMEYIVPAGELNATKCMEILKNSASVHDVVKLVSDLEYGPVLENALEKYDATGELLALEVAVDRHVYSQIWKAIKKLRGLDGRIARTILGLEIDSMNIRVILRLQEAGISQDQAKEHLIPISEVFGQEGLEGAMQAKEARSTIEQLLEAAKVSLARDHQQLLKDLIREFETHKSLSHLETVLDRGLLKTSLRMLKRYTPFFNIGVILAFLNLKWFELRNLRIIINGAEERMPLARTTELLILP